MSDPIVFISHLRVREGKLEEFRRMSAETVPRLESQKPQTVAQLFYLDEDTGRLDIVHVFRDAEGMDRHNEGAGERVNAVADLIDTEGYEIYGTPSEAALNAMRGFAERFGVTLTLHPRYGSGFIRLTAG